MLAAGDGNNNVTNGAIVMAAMALFGTIATWLKARSDKGGKDADAEAVKARSRAKRSEHERDIVAHLLRQMEAMQEESRKTNAGLVEAHKEIALLKTEREVDRVLREHEKEQTAKTIAEVMALRGEVGDLRKEASEERRMREALQEVCTNQQNAINSLEGEVNGLLKKAGQPPKYPDATEPEAKPEP